MHAYNFIDLFAGCGGLSLGLVNAGFEGVFAIEKTDDAFMTFKHNLCDKKHAFKWPKWLPCKNMTTSDLLNSYKKHLEKLSGKVFLIAGGPPCQGFSFAGLRNPKDPRNKLTEEYIEIVSIIRPKVLLLENVKGFKVAFKNAAKIPYSEKVRESLKKKGYKVFMNMVSAADFGVPQLRNRFIMIAVDENYISKELQKCNDKDVLNKILSVAKEQRKIKGLSKKQTTVGDAISDLELSNKNKIECVDCKGFEQLQYEQPTKLNPYLKIMRKGMKRNQMPNSLRLAKHKENTLKRYDYILANAKKGCAVSNAIKEKVNFKKHCLSVLSADKISNTITTIPEDTLHYSESRILTVRETARIQSFPDWYEFQGRYTTGGPRRKLECPRYTQVGNAVPPLMAETLGRFIIELAESEIVYE